LSLKQFQTNHEMIHLRSFRMINNVLLACEKTSDGGIAIV